MDDIVCNICVRCFKEIYDGNYEIDEYGDVYCLDCLEEIRKFIEYEG